MGGVGRRMGTVIQVVGRSRTSGPSWPVIWSTAACLLLVQCFLPASAIGKLFHFPLIDFLILASSTTYLIHNSIRDPDASGPLTSACLCVCVFAGEEVREASNHLLLTSAATL